MNRESRRATGMRRGGIAAGVCLVVVGAALVAFGVRPWSRPAGVPVPDPRPLRTQDTPTRIVALGTSLTARATWPERVAEQLASCGLAATVDIVARPGVGSGWGLRQLGRVVAADPDVVLVEFAINDAALHRLTPLAVSRRRHRQLLTRLAADTDAEIVLLVTNPVEGLRNRLLRPGLDTYYELYRTLARAQGVGAIDVRAAWARLPAAERRGLLPDGLHPSVTADQQITAPAVLRALAPDCAAGGSR